MAVLLAKAQLPESTKKRAIYNFARKFCSAAREPALGAAGLTLRHLFDRTPQAKQAIRFISLTS